MAEISEQIIREAPAVEAYKLGLLKSAKELSETPLQLPAYQTAGLSPLQTQAISLAQSGIGSYAPFLQVGQQAMEGAAGALGAGTRAIQDVNVAPQFQQAQQMLGLGMYPAAAMGEAAAAAGAGMPLVGQGAGMLGQAAGQIPMGAELGASQAMLGQAAANIPSQANLGLSQGLIGQAAMETMAAQPEFGQAQQAIGAGLGAAGQVGAAGLPAQQAAAGTLGMGISGLLGGAQGYDPSSAFGFMNPYQQAVTQQALGEMRRQADIAAQGQAAQAVRAGAFGGTREGVQRAEFERGVQDVMSQRIMQDYAQNFAQAQQAAQQAFEAQQQRQLGAGQALGQAAGMQSQLGTQAANILAQQAGLQGQLGTQLGALEAQRAQLGQSAAGQLGQLGGQLGSQELAQAQLGQAAASQLAGIGGTLGQQQLSQAQLGQAGAGMLGQFGTQMGQMGLLPAQIAAQQASIAGQQAGLYGQLGQGLGSLAAQQGQLGLQQGATLGQVGQAYGQLGLQQSALGEAAQRLGLQDVSTLSTLGALQQQTAQQQLDAARATQLQQAMTPYQQTAFLSDIYKGAPSTQIAATAATAPTTSPLVQAAGLGIAGLGAATGASKAGLFG